MTGTSTVFVGAAAAGPRAQGGLYRKSADGDGFEKVRGGLPEDSQVQAITVHPTDARRIYVGTHAGPYKSVDGGEHWEAMPLPETGLQAWSILVHPSKPQTLYVGTSPVGVFRSDDDGKTWRKLYGQSQPDVVKMDFPCRVMRLAVNPSNHDELYAALEVGGIMRSLDAGESWQDCSKGLIELASRPHLKSKIGSDTDIEGMMDGHALCISSAQPKAIFLAVRMGLFRSEDQGAGWQDMEVGRFSPLTYARDVRVSPQDPSVLYACFSPAARSKDGSLYRSADLGETWSRFDHDVKADATMMAVALHHSDPLQVHCISRSGQLFTTLDGGSSWSQYTLPDGVRDLYAVACT